MEQNKDQGGGTVRGEAVAELLTMRFRKKPVEIEAIQWTGNLECLDAFNIPELHQSLGSKNVGIPTLEGTMIAHVGDWIIKGVKGEFYPCKPEIFELTYVSARAADAPSEPSELHRRVCDVLEGLEGMTLPGALPARVAKLRAAVAAFESGVAADALDSQPTSFDLGSSKQYRQQMAGISCAAHGHWKQGDSIHPDYDTMPIRDVARLYAKYAALLANSQPTELSICRDDGRCQYAIEHQAEGMGHCPVGKCCMPDEESVSLGTACHNLIVYLDNNPPMGESLLCVRQIRNALASSQPTDGGVRNG